jgi:hypothetical protein
MMDGVQSRRVKIICTEPQNQWSLWRDITACANEANQAGTITKNQAQEANRSERRFFFLSSVLLFYPQLLKKDLIIILILAKM